MGGGVKNLGKSEYIISKLSLCNFKLLSKKKMALGSRFQKLRGPLLSGGQRGAKFLKGARFMMAIMFFCKCVISVATLLLIIHITMYILKSYYKMILLF